MVLWIPSEVRDPLIRYQCGNSPGVCAPGCCVSDQVGWRQKRPSASKLTASFACVLARSRRDRSPVGPRPGRDRYRGFVRQAPSRGAPASRGRARDNVHPLVWSIQADPGGVGLAQVRRVPLARRGAVDRSSACAAGRSPCCGGALGRQRATGDRDDAEQGCAAGQAGEKLHGASEIRYRLVSTVVDEARMCQRYTMSQEIGTS